MLIPQVQAAAVVGNQLALSALQVSLPAVARRTLQRGGRKTQQRHPGGGVLRHVAQGLPDLRDRVQIGMLIQQLLVAIVFV